jgi:hypothetical protein
LTPSSANEHVLVALVVAPAYVGALANADPSQLYAYRKPADVSAPDLSA